MPAATVLIPTHCRPQSIRQSIASAQAQSLDDFELFVIGDGVEDSTRDTMAELAAADRRIRFFDGPRKGEHNRHLALAEATGRFVAYLGDDDVWMEHHLKTLDRLLRKADFGHSLHVGVGAQGELSVLPADLAQPTFRGRMLNERFNRFDFTFAGHTLAAYGGSSWPSPGVARGPRWCRPASAPNRTCARPCRTPNGRPSSPAGAPSSPIPLSARSCGAGPCRLSRTA
jgi:glycosyltransferase involved in cell wall biosynthesis